MDKFHTVKRNTDFYNSIHKGFYSKCNSLSLYIYRNNLDTYRFGISVSKKLGNAVYRNKYKRQVRTLIDMHKKDYQKGFDYIIIIRNDFKDLNFEKKDSDFVYLINKIKSFYNKENTNEEK